MGKKIIMDDKRFDIGEDGHIPNGECINSEDGQAQLCNTDEGIEIKEL